ncbi:MAG TPA: hypothetical protein VLG46_07985 [Anaerolineae bacterium]|nr:hypothetical protein [Anaerolineae bacterium]
MKIPKYWARSSQAVQQPDGRSYQLVIWQWSDASREDAQRQADNRVRELEQKIRAGEQLTRYGYGERPLREEITQGVTTDTGREVAIVTRNLYGALVLNAANAMFIDIDFPDKGTSSSTGGGFQWGLGTRAPGQEEQHVEHIASWASRYPDLGIRVYRTFAGLRCLITTQLFEPGRADTLDILRASKSDPLYVRLCQAQACFRARLTPKPWRCNMDTPPSRYPWENYNLEVQFRQWVQRYEQASRSYSVCKLVRQLGPQQIHPDVGAILALHDRLTGVEAERPLA